jgi:putative NADH-flavin reductase
MILLPTPPAAGPLRASLQRVENKRIAVIGSTGRTGRLVLNEGIRREHAITAFTRRPEELAGVQGLHAVVAGDGRRREDIQEAVSGQDAIISIVAPVGRGPTTLMSDVMGAIIDGMRASGVRRLVAVSASAIEGRRPWIAIQLVRWLLRKPYADFVRMERLMAGSGLDWTVVRPPYLSNGPATGQVRMETGRADLARGPYHISRRDLAASLLDLAVTQRHVRDVVLVSEARRRQSPRERKL